MTKEGIEFIKGFEKLKLKAYKCQAGVWTIGYGHTQGVYQGQEITREEAERLFASDLAKFETGVRNILGAVTNRMSENKIDALVSLAFNIGLSAFQKSTLCRLVKANSEDKAIAKEFAEWVYAGGVKSKGLIRRRKAEAEMYFGGGWSSLTREKKKAVGAGNADSLVNQLK